MCRTVSTTYASATAAAFEFPTATAGAGCIAGRLVAFERAAIEVIPAILLAAEAAQLAQATGAGGTPIVRREADTTRAVAGVAAFGAQYFQTLPARLIIELQLRGTRFGVPTGDQIIDIAAYEGGEPRTHQRLRGHRRARATDRRLATFAIGAAGTAGAQLGRHNASRVLRPGEQVIQQTT